MPVFMSGPLNLCNDYLLPPKAAYNIETRKSYSRIGVYISIAILTSIFFEGSIMCIFKELLNYMKSCISGVSLILVKSVTQIPGCVNVVMRNTGKTILKFSYNHVDA